MSRNNPVHTNIPATGRVGAEPPPGAPHEIAQPLQANAGQIVVYGVDPTTGRPMPTGEVVDPMERARQNERQLDPNPKFNTGPGPGDVTHTASGSAHSTGGVAEATIAAREGKLDPFYARMAVEGPAHSAAGEGADGSRLAPQRVVDQSQVQPHALPATSGSRILRRRPHVAPPSPAASDQVPVAAASVAADQPAAVVLPPPVAATGFPPPDDDAPPLTTEEIDAVAAAAELAVLQLTHPAASNTDSPSRGMPRRDPRAGLNVTGGWGDANAGAQYFALSGDDLKIISQQMLLELHDRIDNDLRFSIALVYPRVSIRATLQIHGFAGGPQSFEIERVRPADVAGPGGSPAPEAVAAALADEVVFTLIAERREVDDDGQSVAAPDQLRNEFGMPRPGKHVVGGAGNNKRMADV